MVTTGHTYALEGDHTYSSEAISTGYRVYTQNCALCHGFEGNWIEDIDLSRGKFRTVVTDHDIRGVILEGAGEGQMPSFDLSDAELDGLIGYIRIGFDPDGAAVSIGDAQQGRLLFNGKGACGSCHRIAGRGPRTAPDLSDIGLLRPPAALQRTLVDPQESLLPINRPVTVITADEEVIIGRRLNEDTHTVQIIDSQEQLRSLIKAELKLYEVSEIPTHKPTSLSGEEVADLVAYLMSLRGQL
jgi:putative heme-binding domain-containing protein